jgi:ribosomal protein L3
MLMGSVRKKPQTTTQRTQTTTQIKQTEHIEEIEMSKISVSNRRSVFSPLEKYCHCSAENDFIEVTEWTNGEGFDVTVSRVNGEDVFKLTHGELTLLNILANYHSE